MKKEEIGGERRKISVQFFEMTIMHTHGDVS